MSDEDTKNEFEDLDSTEEVPALEFDEVPQTEEESMLASGEAGEIYDWNKAPDVVKAPPREDLDGKTITILKAELTLPTKDSPWKKTRKGDKEFKPCKFVLFYDINNQQEFYSGVRVFKRIVDGKEMYSHPSIPKDRKNQASNLLGTYSDFKKIDINLATMKEFLAFLNSKPKGEIKGKVFKNPETEEEVTKNIVVGFEN